MDPTLPPGFSLDDTPGGSVPTGFTLDDTPPPVAAPPAGFKLDETPTPESRSFLQRNVTDPIGRGWNNLKTGGAVLGGELGLLTPEEVAASALQNQQNAAQYPMQPDVAAGLQEIKNAQGWMDAGKAIITNPKAVLNVAVESLPASLGTVAGGLGGALAGTAVTPGAGTIGGTILGAGVMSGANEYASTIMDMLKEAGLPPTETAMAAALQDPTFMAEARRRGSLRGLAVGGFDGLTAGIAGRIADPVKKVLTGRVGSATGRAVAGGTAELGAQAGGGAAGEASGQLLADGRIKEPGAVLLEAAAEIPGSAVDIPGGILSRKIGENAAQAPTAPPALPPGFVLDTTPQLQTEATNAPAPAAPAPAVPAPAPEEPAASETPAPVPPVPAEPSAPAPVSTEPQGVEAAPVIAPTETPAAPPPPPDTSGRRMSRVTTPVGNQSFDTEFQVVSADDLQAAQGDLQPRDRATRAASEDQINSIVTKFDPARLIDDQMSDRGSPIVDENNTVLSGNGRVEVLRRVQQTYPEKYQAYLDTLRQQGFEIPDGVQNPVLIRRLSGLDPEGKRQFVINSNKDSKLAMSPAEQAKVDADLLDESALAAINTDSEMGISGAANVGFVRTIMGRLDANERAAFMTEGGALSPAGARRLEAALFAKAFSDPALTGRIVEDEEGGGTRNALLAVAPAWAQMRSSAPQALDITPNLTDAVTKVAELRRQGVKLREYLDQQDAFEQRDPLTVALMKAFYNETGTRVAAWRDTRDFLKEYAKLAMDEGRAVGRLDGTSRSSVDLLNELETRRGRGEDLSGQQGGLFERVQRGGTEPVRVTFTEGNAKNRVQQASRSRPEQISEQERIPRGGLAPSFMDRALTNRASIYEQAFRDAGLNPDEGKLLPPEKQVAVLSKLLKDKFGFAVVADKGPGGKALALDAIDQMLDAYRNLQFMAHALGMPNTAFGLGDRLKLSMEKFKGRYLGAYFPGDTLIAMPGRSNSFAHEWAHALDHYLMDQLNASGVKAETMLTRFARKEGLPQVDTLPEAFVNVLNTIFFDDAALAARVIQLQIEASKVNKTTGQPTVAAGEARAQLQRINEGNSKARGIDSEYRKSSAQFGQGNPYWTDAAEMFARAFEAYVAHKVEALGGTTEFISKTDESYLSNADARLRMTFPKLDTRMSIFHAFDELMGVLQNQQFFGSDPAAARPGDYDLVDPNRWIKVAGAIPDPTLGQQIKQELGTISRVATNPLKAVKELLGTTALRAGLAENAGLDTRLPWHQRVRDTARIFVFSMRGATKDLIARNPAEAQPYLRAVLDMFATDPGTGRTITETYEEAVRARLKQDTNQIAALLKANGVNERLRGDQADRVRDLLLGKSVQASSQERAVAAGLRRLLDKAWRDNRAAGIEQGYVANTGYLSRMIEPRTVINDPTGFERQASKAYAINFDKQVQEIPDLNEKIKEVSAFNKALLYRRDFTDARDAMNAATKALVNHQRSKNPNPQTTSRLEQELQDAFEKLRDIVRPIWSDMKAQRWSEELRQGSPMDLATRGPDSVAKEARSLPPETDTLLKEYYVSNPLDATVHYLSASARSREFVRRAGSPMSEAKDLTSFMQQKRIQDEIRANPARYNVATPAGRIRVITELTGPDVNRVEMLFREALRKDALPDDIRQIREFVEVTSGSHRASTAVSRLSSVLYAMGTLALLPRAMWTSIAEPVSVYMQTGSFKASMSTLGAYLSEARSNLKTVQDRRQLSEVIGLTTSPFYESIVHQSMDGAFGDSVQTQRLLANFFMRTGLTQLTNAQRRATLQGGWVWFNELADLATGTDRTKATLARAELRDLGVEEGQINDLVDWMKQHNGLPTADELDTKAGKIYQTMANRFADLIIQDPKRMDKPLYANSTWGRLTYGIMAFNYAFARNVHMRMLNKGIRDTDIRVQTGQSLAGARVSSFAEGAKHFTVGFTAIIAAQLLVSVLREALFNGDMWDEKRAKGELGKWLVDLAISRSGILGPADLINQLRTGLKYERDLTALTAGPHVGYFLNAAQGMAGPFIERRGQQNPARDPNKPQPNTAQWNAVKSAYQAFAVPAIAATMSSLPGGPISGAALGFGLQKLTANSTADKVANAVAGPKASRQKLIERERARSQGF